MSRAVGALQFFVTDVLSAPHIQHVIKEPMYKSANKEAMELLSHLKAPNAGGLPMPGSKSKDDRTAMFKCRRTDVPVPERMTIETAATGRDPRPTRPRAHGSTLVMLSGRGAVGPRLRYTRGSTRSHRT